MPWRILERYVASISSRGCYKSWLHPQAVVENKNDMKELMERVDECAKVVGDALNEAVSDIARDRIDIFVQYVVHHGLLDI
jgi:hypothetical protein